MYGLIFENFSGYVKVKYGAETWDQLRKLVNVEPTFDIHKVSQK